MKPEFLRLHDIYIEHGKAPCCEWCMLAMPFDNDGVICKSCCEGELWQSKDFICGAFLPA